MLDSTTSSPTTLDLQSKVMLVSLNISVWAGEKVDQAITNQVEETHGIERRTAGRFTKLIICKPALATIKELAGQARTQHYDRTLPWNDIGGRLLSASGYMTYMDTMAGIQERFQSEIGKFITAYPRIIDEARHRLKDTFDINDYPNVSGVKSKFEFTVNCSPLPSSNNWFMDLADSEMIKLQQDNDARVTKAVHDSITDVYRRVADVTGKMSTKLSSYERDAATNKVTQGKFRDSLVENVRELSSLLPSLNITNDPLLNDLNAKLRELTRYEPCQLRAEETMRAEIAGKAQSVFDLVAGML